MNDAMGILAAHTGNKGLKKATKRTPWWITIYKIYCILYTGMFKFQGRLNTIRKEVIRERGCNPSNT